ncbi:glycosyltransferase family 1 protein, partial [Enterococcus hulanensis]|nr:glycosyltransferase family 1 protein [Enterococcus hulanensis]
WETVTRRLYKNKNEYHRYNNRVSDNKKYLFSSTTPPEKMDGQYKIVSTFEDAVGKIHTWSLRDADSESSGMKIDAALELLSSLTIFEKDGIRRFVKLENSDIFNCTRYPKVRHGVVLENSVVEESPSQNPAQQPAAFDFSNLSDAEKLALVKMLLPEGIVLTDARMTELGDEAKSESPATVAQKAEPNSAGSTSAVKEKP